MAAYRYRRLDPVPFAVPRRPLSSARVALVSSGAVHLPEQTPFADDVEGGDFSFREIPGDVEVARLLVAHKSDAFDQTGLLEDRNLAFPLDRLREMAGRGEIGSLNARHVSFMGSITAPGRLLSQTAPTAADLLAADGVDVAILTPL